MNNEIETLYRTIGETALGLAPGLKGKLLVYAEVEDGAISADLIFAQGPGKPLRFRFCPPAMQNTINSLWARWQTVPGNAEWRVMNYVIEEGSFRVDLEYPDEIDEDEDVSDRRPRAIRKYFGEAAVDYSNP